MTGSIWPVGHSRSPLIHNYWIKQHKLDAEYRREAVPQNNPSNGKFRLLIEAWRRLPIPVANTVGPLVVRGLG